MCSIYIVLVSQFLARFTLRASIFSFRVFWYRCMTMNWSWTPLHCLYKCIPYICVTSLTKSQISVLNLSFRSQNRSPFVWQYWLHWFHWCYIDNYNGECIQIPQNDFELHNMKSIPYKSNLFLSFALWHKWHWIPQDHSSRYIIHVCVSSNPEIQLSPRPTVSPAISEWEAILRQIHHMLPLVRC